MCFIKTIAGKAFHLPPYLCSQGFCMTLLFTTGHILFPDHGKLVIAPVFATHGTSQNICLAKIKPCKIVRYFYHIFLEHHHTKSFF